MEKPIIRLVTCGSVDDGKSTLIGRLLVETDSVPDDTVDAAKSVRRSGSTIKAGEIDFSLLTDGLEAEREQGITIDVAYRSMNLLNGRRLIIADAPGHEQYTRNMAVAASRADIALVLVDATRGIRTQTLRHLTICSLMGVTKIAVVINKLDGVGYSEQVYKDIQEVLKETIERLEITNIEFVPVSALAGDNVVYGTENMPWYQGPTLLEYIQQWDVEDAGENLPRLGVQMISRAENFRGLAGTIVGGKFAVGDEVAVLPSKKTAKISQISTFDCDLQTAEDRQAVTLVLEPDVDATRGDVIELAEKASSPADRFAATVVWLGESDLIRSKSYYLISGSTQVPAIVTNIRHVLNINNGEHDAARTLKTNEIGVVELATDAPIALTPYKQNRFKGNFILVDRATMNTVGAGMVIHALRRSANVSEHHYEIDRDSRAAQKNQRAQVIWLTGLSGSGKSTIANALEKKLFSLGMHAYVLDGDNMRLGLNKDLGFTREDRAENVRRVSEVAHSLYDAGLIVIVALVSPYSEDRAQAKALFPEGDFAEVWVKTPAEVCAERDPKGLYKKAAAGELPNLTGVGQEYEAPEGAELVLDGTVPIEENLETLLNKVF
ncbi:CysN GTPases - Sulfate adenylate transferase subunit 1 [Microbacteriaceae bacterium]